MLELTEQQQQAIDASAEPPRLVDPRTNRAYVLIGADAYERLRVLLAEDGGPTMEEVGLLVEQSMREDDLSDPSLKFYQEKYGNT